VDGVKPVFDQDKKELRMSGVGFRATKGDISTGTAAKTIGQVVAAANHAANLSEISVSFKGGSSDVPVLVEVLRQTTAGTMSSLTPVKSPDDSDETLQVTAQHTATAEPTAGDILDTQYVPAQSGYTWVVDDADEFKIGGGDRIGIRVTSAVDFKCAWSVKGKE